MWIIWVGVFTSHLKFQILSGTLLSGIRLMSHSQVWTFSFIAPSLPIALPGYNHLCLQLKKKKNWKINLFCKCVCVFTRPVMSDFLWPMDYSPSSSSAHGIFQARILEWVSISSSMGCYRPGIEAVSPEHLLHCRPIIYHWDIGKTHYINKSYQ